MPKSPTRRGANPRPAPLPPHLVRLNEWSASRQSKRRWAEREIAKAACSAEFGASPMRRLAGAVGLAAAVLYTPEEKWSDPTRLAYKLVMDPRMKDHVHALLESSARPGSESWDWRFYNAVEQCLRSCGRKWETKTKARREEMLRKIGEQAARLAELLRDTPMDRNLGELLPPATVLRILQHLPTETAALVESSPRRNGPTWSSEKALGLVLELGTVSELLERVATSRSVQAPGEIASTLERSRVNERPGSPKRNFQRSLVSYLRSAHDLPLEAIHKVTAVVAEVVFDLEKPIRAAHVREKMPESKRAR